MGVTLKILWIPHTTSHHTTMYKLMLTSLLAVASSLPIEDTLEVAAAKAEFKAAFDAASAGAHAALAPVNNDLQAEQIALSYLADSEDVAAAKAESLAAFDSAAAGGLAAKQAPAPVHTIPAPAPLAAPVAALPAAFPYGVTALNAALPYHGYPLAAGLPYAGYAHAALPFAGYAGLPVLAATKTA